MALAAPRTWVVGEVVTAAHLNAEIRNQFDDLIAAWTAYTPTWTSGGTAPAIGNGSLAGRHKLLGKTCTAVVEMQAGTTTTFGTGTWAFGLPFTAANPGSTTANFAYLGSGRAHSATQWETGVSAVIKNTAQVRVFTHATVAEWSSTQPHAWAAATTNYLHIQVTYETA